MLSPIDELKIQAKKRCTEVRNTHQSDTRKKLTLKQVQLEIARKYGFVDWLHARDVLDCGSGEPKMGFGKFWYSNKCATLLNNWCGNMSEAKLLQYQQGGVILPYQNQFLLADKHFLALIGLQIDDPLWSRLGNNWCEGPAATRKALALKRIKALSN